MYNDDTGVPRITSPHITLYHYSQVGPKIFCITLFHLVYVPQIALSYFMKIQILSSDSNFTVSHCNTFFRNRK